MKANELGHLLAKHEIIMRFRELAEKLEKDEDSKQILNELFEVTQSFEAKERANQPIEADEKKQLADLQDKAKDNSLISEFLATQAYYINILSAVNEAIANPQGEPPRESDIILPGDDKGVIIT
ncbi:MAG: YlbF/YmcA family competence regulator [Planctomycetota bacterium]